MSRAEDIIQSIVDGTKYDEPAQSRIEYLLKELKRVIEDWNKVGVHLIGETSTALTDNTTTNPITIDGESYTAQPNDAVIYEHKEFLFDGTKWHEFGDLTGLSSKDIGAMTNYVKAVTASYIDQTDTLNQAIGKLEKRVSDNENNISNITMSPYPVSSGDLDDITTNTYAMYTGDVSNRPSIDGTWYFVKTTIFDPTTIYQEAVAFNANESTYTRIKRSNTWQEWRLSNLTNNQYIAVNSGIDSTKVAQITTNASDISTLQTQMGDVNTALTNINTALGGVI